MSATVKLCKDCRHCMPNSSFAPGSQGAFAYADCDLSPYIDLVTGEERFHYCETERKEGSCGSVGAKWDAKP